MLAMLMTCDSGRARSVLRKRRVRRNRDVEVEGYQPIPLVVGHFQRGAIPGDAGVVDENVEAAPGVANLADEGVERGKIGQVANRGRYLAPEGAELSSGFVGGCGV